MRCPGVLRSPDPPRPDSGVRRPRRFRSPCTVRLDPSSSVLPVREYHLNEEGTGPVSIPIPVITPPRSPHPHSMVVKCPPVPDDPSPTSDIHGSRGWVSVFPEVFRGEPSNLPKGSKRRPLRTNRRGIGSSLSWWPGVFVSRTMKCTESGGISGTGEEGTTGVRTLWTSTLVCQIVEQRHR